MTKERGDTVTRQRQVDVEREARVGELEARGDAGIRAAGCDRSHDRFLVGASE